MLRLMEVGAEISSQCPVTCFRCIPCLPSIAHNCNETGDISVCSDATYTPPSLAKPDDAQG
eukprot:704470-Amphidinium_carterae.1